MWDVDPASPSVLSLSKARHCPLVTKRWSYCKYINRAHLGRIQSLWIMHQSPQNNKQYHWKYKGRLGWEWLHTISISNDNVNKMSLFESTGLWQEAVKVISHTNQAPLIQHKQPERSSRKSAMIESQPYSHGLVSVNLPEHHGTWGHVTSWT